MLTEQTRVEVLKLSVEQARRDRPADDFGGAVAEIYTRFYNLIDSDPSPAAKPDGKRKAGKTATPEIFG